MNAVTLRLSNRVAIVTGAGSGIGRGCALRLAAEGARVALVDVSRKGGEESLLLIQKSDGDGFFL